MQGARFRAIVAVHLLLVRGDEVLLLRRANTGYEDGNFSVPAGHLDGGEPVIEAAIREAREEIGIELRAAETRVIGVMHRLAEEERVDFFVTASGWAGEPRNLEPDKCDDLRWFSRDDLPGNVIPYVRRAIDLGVEGRWFDQFGWDAARAILSAGPDAGARTMSSHSDKEDA
jgi:ADP-ribose pyrophosphatase YjhB (NUDIX family)